MALEIGGQVELVVALPHGAVVDRGFVCEMDHLDNPVVEVGAGLARAREGKGPAYPEAWGMGWVIEDLVILRDVEIERERAIGHLVPPVNEEAVRLEAGLDLGPWDALEVGAEARFVG